MERQAGVRKFKFDINTGHGFARIKDKDKVDLPKIRKATKSAGFKLFSLDLELTGQIRRVKGADHKDVLVIHLERANQDVFLRLGKSKGERSNYQAVLKYAGKKTRLTVRGPADEDPKTGPWLTIAKFEVVPDKPKARR